MRVLLVVEGEPVRQLRDECLRIRPRVHANVVALESAGERLCLPLDCGLLTGVVREAGPMSRAKVRVSRAV